MQIKLTLASDCLPLNNINNQSSFHMAIQTTFELCNIKTVCYVSHFVTSCLCVCECACVTFK